MTARTVTAETLSDCLLQDLYFERKWQNSVSPGQLVLVTGLSGF